jgi:hypothetical protein
MVASYGTIQVPSQEPERVERSARNTYVAVFAAVALLTVGVVAFSSPLARARMSSTVDANRERLEMGQIDPGVKELGMEVLNMTVSGLRWAIFGFNSDYTKIIPLTAAPATADWEKDFKMFTNALPTDDAAVGVYNFEYWVSDTDTGNEPVMITWAPHCDQSTDRTGRCVGMDAREEARAGYFLPGIILALQHESAQGRINTLKMKGTKTIDTIGAVKKGYNPPPEGMAMFSGPYRLDSISDTYYSFCITEMGMPEKDCSLEKRFHNCPFESEDESQWTENNPCSQPQCAGDEFQRPEEAMAGAISQPCCNYIEDDFCADPANYATVGCHAVTLTAIDKLCTIPKPPQPVFVEFNWAEEAKCTPACADACGIIAERGDPNDTWRMCEGCRLDMMPDDTAQNPGQISQCYPGAYGYEMNTCCGNAQDDDGHLFCQEDENLSYEVCSMLEYFNCKWIPQKDCPNEVRAQDIEEAPVGCCYHPNYSEPDNLFGTTGSFNFDMAAVDVSGRNFPSWNYDSGVLDEMIPGVLCGEGKYVEHDSHIEGHDGEDPHEGEIFAEGQTCADVKAGFDAQLEAYREAQRLAFMTTTPAPARRV